MSALFPVPTNKISISELISFRDRINACIEKYIADPDHDPDLQIGLNLLLERFDKVNLLYFTSLDSDPESDDSESDDSVDPEKLKAEWESTQRIYDKILGCQQ